MRRTLSILDTEECPCGSKQPYIKCCKRRKDEKLNLEEFFKNEGRLNHEAVESLKKSKIRICLHPNNNECSKDIKNAHSLQNNGVLSLIAEDGHVIDIKPGIGINGIKISIKPESKNRATTFTGFCGFHDTEIFKPIETSPYNPNSDQQNFLFAYRIYAYEYYKKIVAFKSFQRMIKRFPTRLHYEMFVKLFRNYQLSMKDFDVYKDIMNNCLINSDFTKLNTFVIEFDYRISFATCFGFAPLFDFEGNPLSLTHMLEFNEDRLKMNFVTAIPQESKSYIIYSWLKEDDFYFKEYINQLKKLNTNEIKRIFNNLIPEYTENLILAPKLWDRFSEYQREILVNKLTSEYPRFFSGEMHVDNTLENKSNFFDRAPYNLFRMF